MWFPDTDMTTAVIVQARMGSTRLPGKVMRDLADRPVLSHVLERCARIPGADVVVCAMPDEAASDALEVVASKAGARCFRGSESDVLSRYVGAARFVGAEVVMRVTSDCPLIDPDICGAVLALRAQQGADYAANNMPPTFPHGIDCEAMTFTALVEAEEIAREAYDREHVTPWLRRAPHVHRVNLSSDDANLAQHRWTLDYPEDLEFFRAVFSLLPEEGAYGMADVLSLLQRQPSLSQINSMRSV
jgi:glutamate-1-semialdehyde 2,1-aminomutase/spore coat polysaccharide biosynthesis protein SpsF